jgi:CRISPR/Cas system-associated exonuclease Cas4 (RecB family)
VPVTPELRAAVLQAAAEIRRARTAADVPRQHHAPERCRHCGYRSACTQALA